MEKFRSFIFLFFLFFALSIYTDNTAFAIEEITEEYIILPDEGIQSPLEINENEHKIIYEEEINPYSKESLKGIVQKDYDLSVPNNIFEEQLKLKFKKGPLQDFHTRVNLQATMGENIDTKTGSYAKFDMRTINVGFRGKFKGGKESFNTLFNLAPVHENFFHRLVLDAWIESSRVKNNRIMLGTFRPAVGIEGEQSAYTIPFLYRSQTARHFANVRKTGLRVKGNYRYANYDIGGYSSDTYYTDLFTGVEADVWVGIKPLAIIEDVIEKKRNKNIQNISDINTNSKENISKKENKWGNLNIGGGYSAGSRHSKDFQVISTGIQYDYKNFWMRAEYQNANGSNGADGITTKKRHGYNATIAYRLTKKLEILLRYDDFNPDQKISHNNSREYSAGINYFIIGQGLRVMLNYIFCDNQSAKNSHKLILGTQILL